MGTRTPRCAATSRGLLVAGVHVPDHAHPRVVGEHPLQLLPGQRGAVGHAHLAGVDGPADADPAAVVDAHPGRAGSRVDQRVQQRPVGDRVGAVGHPLGLPVGRGHRPAVEVVAAEHDRGLHVAPGDQLVEPDPGQVPLAVAEPADPRRQTLEVDLLLGHPDPPGQRLVIGEQVEDGGVGGGDVGRVTGQRGPAERPPALAEQRPDVGGHEAGEVERPGIAGQLRLAPDRVAVVEDLRAGVHEPDHRLDVHGHRLPGPLGEAGRVLGPQRGHVLERHAARQVGQRVVS